MINSLINFFKKENSKETLNEVPDGFCPNCWGEQEYDKVIRKMYIDKQIDVNNGAANYAFIQEFVVTHVNGIHLKKGNNSLECPTCKITFNKN